MGGEDSPDRLAEAQASLLVSEIQGGSHSPSRVVGLIVRLRAARHAKRFLHDEETARECVAQLDVLAPDSWAAKQ